MHRHFTPVADGLLSGLLAAVAVDAGCLLLGGSGRECGGWLFMGGGVLASLSALWTLAGLGDPPGVLAFLAGRVMLPPMARREGLWMDRFITLRNAWLVGGLTMVALSFMPPFLH